MSTKRLKEEEEEEEEAVNAIGTDLERKVPEKNNVSTRLSGSGGGGDACLSPKCKVE